MKHIESSQKIYETSNLDIFKNLVGNRETVASNIKKLSIGMRDMGWVGAPIVVNEHLEVIDGQNRLEAAKERGITIPYMICEGYGIKECIMLNRNVRNWNTTDYVNSYASQDYENYVWLKNMKKKYPEFTMDELSGLAINKGKNMTQSDTSREKIRGGQLMLTDEEKDFVEDTILFLKDFTPMVKKIAGRLFITYNAIMYYRSIDNCDMNKLLEKVFKNNWGQIKRSHAPEEYLAQIDKIYNSGIKNASNRIYAARKFEDERVRTSSK